MADIFNTIQAAEALNTMKNVLNSLVGMVYVTVPETGEILFISDSMKRHYKIEGDVTGQICYKVVQAGINERCPFCPCYKLDKNPDSTVVWEEHSTLTKRIYRNTDRYMDWPGRNRVHFQHSVDITDLIQANEEIKRHKEQTDALNNWYKSILDTIPLPVTVTDADMNWTFVNKSVENFLGTKLEDMLGRQCSNWGATICNTPDCGIACAKRGEKRTFFAHNEASYQVDVDILKNPDGETTGYVEVVQDITQRKEAELEIEEMSNKKARAEAANQAKSEFLANMSHEIRTPMNSIIGFSDLALGEVVSPKAKEYLHNIMESSKLLLQIINDILDLSKIESGNMVLENIPFALQDLLANCQSIIYPKAIEKDVDVHFQAEPSFEKKLNGDPLRLRQVLLNLLSNAVKFTDAGQINLSAKIIDRNDKEATLRFEVSDSGIGMTPEQIAVILEPFIQADISTTREYGGTGLGLSISNNILELMGSKLDIESTPGSGSKFSFTVTLDIAGDLDEITEQISDIRSVKKPVFAGDVLVFEDNKLNQQVIIEHLAKVGLRTEIAENGLIGIEKVKQRIENGEKPYDLIFMDIQMPVMDGIEATPKVIALSTKTPIITMTADVLVEDKELYQKLGMVDYLCKPFTSNELWRCLLQHLKPLRYEESEIEETTFNRKMKIDFLNSYQDIFNEITNAIDTGDNTLAQRMAHNIKSNAGLIGQIKLQKAAAEVEDAFRNGRKPDTEMQIFHYELDKVLDELKPLLIKPEGRARHDIPVKPLDAEAARELFDKLEPLLHSSSIECLDLIDELRGIAGSDELIEQMEDLYFGAAEKTLKKLRETIDK